MAAFRLLSENGKHGLKAFQLADVNPNRATQLHFIAKKKLLSTLNLRL
jgi:hypothetical protein